MSKRLLLVTMVVSWFAAPAATAVAGGGNSSATITGSFADSCRDFTTHSTKDISYVKLRYASGLVVKHENVNSHDWTVDGGPGEEIDSARVKSGTTREEFACEPASAAPTALLEVRTPPIQQTFETCYDFFAGGLDCEQSSARTAWTSNAQIPDNGGDDSGHLVWGCGGLTDPSLCSFAITFRGVGSSDPDDDIESWSLDFGDGTSVSGDWSSPPTEVTHLYVLSPPVTGNYCVGVPGAPFLCGVVFTVTDAAGQSDSDTLLMVFLDQSPD
jgi:hypothetical protein